SALLPEDLRNASRTFFTPIKVAKAASSWLTEDGKKTVLDIGSGVGKFCISSAINSKSFFYGVEYRPSLVQLSLKLAKRFDVANVHFERANILQINFANFDAFYMYNPFYENLLFGFTLNDEVRLAGHLYGCYLKYTEVQLD